jgi:hypothetical protein
MQLADIERLTRSYADSHNGLVETVGDLNNKIEQLKREFLPAIRRGVRSTAERRSVLDAAIKEAADLFIKPRTHVFHGVKVGLRRDGGSLIWENEEDVLRLIKKHFADRKDDLIRTTEKLSVATLATLAPADLKKVGVTATEPYDVVVISPSDSNVDKIVSALLKDHEETAQEMEAA